MTTILDVLAEAGIEPTRHGQFVGYRNIRRMPAHLWGQVEQHEQALLESLPDSPTPFEARLAALVERKEVPR
jgi:hypothetical protein